MRQSSVVNDTTTTSQVDSAEDGWGRGKLVRIMFIFSSKKLPLHMPSHFKNHNRASLISLDFVLHNISHISKVLKASFHTTDRKTTSMKGTN